ncbi:MAG: histidine triad nucleotide-binding protein [Gammaproteobacteria bacterium]
MACLFCKIINKEIPSDIIYEDQDILGFNDVNPQAPIHALFIPKKHISTVNDFSDTETLIAGKLIMAAQHYASNISVADNGYRLVMNCNNDGGQTVYHIHCHFLAGRQLHWPPG